jgi:siroheme decarboxylase
MTALLDDLDRTLLDRLQDGIAVADRPFLALAQELGITEDLLLDRLRRMLADGVLTRFGPMFNAEAMGGAFCLCAMAVPEEDIDAVAELVNAWPEVAHNYERAHRLNMWFVLAADRPERIEEVADEIETRTGLAVLRLPKEAEFFLRLKVAA